MPGGTPGPKGVSGRTESVKDGKTTALLAAPPPSTLGITYDMNDGLSYELADAPAVCVPTKLRHVSLAEVRVIALLRDHKSLFVDAESMFNVDRRAVAGAIAGEGLLNNSFWTNLAHRFGIGRSVGWGKEHLVASLFFGGVRSTWAFQVEKRGLLKKQSDDDRRAILATPEGAVKYIAATMDLIARIYEDSGSPGICSPSMRNNPVILVNEYQGGNADKWAAQVKTFTPNHVLKAGNSIALWLAVPRNMTLVEDGVGTPVKSFARRDTR
jgi:hypothetical protein